MNVRDDEQLLFRLKHVYMPKSHIMTTGCISPYYNAVRMVTQIFSESTYHRTIANFLVEGDARINTTETVYEGVC